MKKLKILAVFFFSLVALTLSFTKDTYAANKVAKKTAWNRAEIRWQAVANANHYNIYFGVSNKMSPGKFIGAVRDIPAMQGWNMTWVNHLQPGVKYFYRIAAVDNNGVEFWWSPEMMMKVQSMPKSMVSDMEPSR